MKWDEFKKQLEAANLSQVKFGELTGYSEQVVSRWQHRKNGVPRWVSTWLRLYRGGRGKVVMT